jgi:transcriptional regulator with XRE-family HTH domain
MSAKRPDAIDRLVAHNIRIQCITKGMSQTELATRLGVTFQQVQKYEKGVNRVGGGRLVHIAEALGVSLTTLFDGIGIADERRPRRPPPLHLLADAQALRLAEAFARIKDKALRRMVAQMVEMIGPEGR